MAQSLIGQQAPSLVTTADNYMHNVFGAVGGDTSDSVSSSHLRSAQPVAVQQYDKVQRMVDAMKVCAQMCVYAYEIVSKRVWCVCVEVVIGTHTHAHAWLSS